MTAFGVAWIVIIFFCSLSRIEYLASALMVSTIFRSVSIVSLGSSFSLLAQDVTSLLFVMRFLGASRFDGKLDIRTALAMAFVAFALLQGTAALLFFEGFELSSFDSVFLGYDVAGELIRTGSTSVSLSPGFFIAIGRLFLYLAAFCSLVVLATSWSQFDRALSVRLAIQGSFVLIVLVGIIQLLGSFDLIDSSPIMTLFHTEEYADSSAYYNNYRALYSVFSEPSYCGPWLMGLGWAVILEGRNSTSSKVVGGIGIALGVLTFSATAMAVFIVGLFIFIRRRANRQAGTIVLAFCALVIVCLATPPVRHLIEVSWYKLSSASGVTRLSYSEQCYSIFFQTFGFGLGFNQVQSMTLIGGLLAQVGLIGSLLFGAMLYKTYQNRSQDTIGRFSGLFFVLVLFGVEVSCSGILYSGPFWFVFYLLAACSAPFEKKKPAEVRG